MGKSRQHCQTSLDVLKSRHTPTLGQIVFLIRRKLQREYLQHFDLDLFQRMNRTFNAGKR